MKRKEGEMIKQKSIHVWILLILIVVGNFFAWKFLYKERSVIGSISHIQCISYDPRHIYVNNMSGDKTPVDLEAVDRDLKIISKLTKCIRLYRSIGKMSEVPRIAAKYGIDVIAGAWLEGKKKTEDDKVEIAALIEIANSNKNVKQVIVGNEVLQWGRMSVPSLFTHIREVRSKVSVPVSTSENPALWRYFPEIAEEVDFISLHTLPYWDSVGSERALDWAFNTYYEIQSLFKGKEVFVGEIGWPSEGPERKASVPSLVNQAQFITAFIQRAESSGIRYNLFEAFDQPWKMFDEGRAGAHWGILKANGSLKSSLTGSVSNDEIWYVWAGIISLVFFAFGMFLILKFKHIRFYGYLLGFFIFFVFLTLFVLMFQTTISEYMLHRPFIWLFIVPTYILLFVVLEVQTFEAMEVVGRKKLMRNSVITLTNATPFISIHLPCRNEDPKKVIRAIDSLLKLNYKNFEIVVIDNNTTSELLWRPIEEYAKNHKERVKFYHFNEMKGFKAGALNFALTVTDSHTEFVGVIDADYQVLPHWISRVLPYFEDKTIAVVQAPQAHEGKNISSFESFVIDEYNGFFGIGMVQRNEKDAIIQHGTMTLIRKSVLVELGGWGEWSITEDAELGLRILNAGYSMYYVNEVLGFGEVAPSFEAYKKQRFRWVYGAVRISMKYWRELLGFRGKLNRAQRISFVLGWISWFAEGLYPVFIVLGVLGSALIMYDERFFPPVQFLYPIIFLLIARALIVIATYRERITKKWGRIIKAMIAGASLTPTISRAIWTAFVYAKKPFVQTRTIGKEQYSIVLHAALCVWFCISSAMLISSQGIFNKDASIWMITLFILSIPSLCVLTMSVLKRDSYNK
ncbi:MAG: glycosyltransferase [Candidatus Paceibacterota bacterium]|jgi:exo-beta-1,3-glucanase (GH17 family)/cellulose synthase/poly-beta-1,6-N-acetylglucosamine synthase-like glycosyltransferase